MLHWLRSGENPHGSCVSAVGQFIWSWPKSTCPCEFRPSSDRRGRGEGELRQPLGPGGWELLLLLAGSRMTCRQDPGHVHPFTIVIQTQERELHAHWCKRGQPEHLGPAEGPLLRGTVGLRPLYCFIDHTKAFDCVDHNKPWMLLKEMGHQTPWPASWEACVQVRKRQLEPDME